MTWQMSEATTAPPVDPQRHGRRLIISGAGLIVLALIIVICSAVLLVMAIGHPISETLSNPIRQTPVAASDLLTEGTYTVYERVDQSDDPTSLDASQVRVRTSAGASLHVSSASTSSEIITRGPGNVFRAAAKFKIPQAGRYDIAVDKLPDPGQVIVAPSLAGEFARAVGWIVAMIFGGLLLVLGILLLIIGLFRRHQKRNSPPLFNRA
jgi:hypothetical protein